MQFASLKLPISRKPHLCCFFRHRETRDPLENSVYWQPKGPVDLKYHTLYIIHREKFTGRELLDPEAQKNRRMLTVCTGQM